MKLSSSVLPQLLLLLRLPLLLLVVVALLMVVIIYSVHGVGRIQDQDVVRRPSGGCCRPGGGCFGGDCARAGHGEKEAFFFLKMKCI